MAQHGEPRRRYVRHAQDCSNAVTMRIMKDQSLFYYAAQLENPPAGGSKRSSSKAAGESKPEAYPRGYVEDFDESRTLLADFFSILLLGLEKIEMIRRSGSMTDCQAMAKGFGEVGFGRLYGVVHGFASCEMRRDG